jgi:hypothetical protein
MAVSTSPNVRSWDPKSPSMSAALREQKERETRRAAREAQLAERAARLAARASSS